MTTNHEHGERRCLAADDLEDLHPVQFAALQPDIEHDQRRLTLANSGKRRGAVTRFTGLVPLILKDTGDEHPDIGFVVNNEYVMSHGTGLPFFPQCRSIRVGHAVNRTSDRSEIPSLPWHRLMGNPLARGNPRGLP